jgi:hypothetical protein
LTRRCDKDGDRVVVGDVAGGGGLRRQRQQPAAADHPLLEEEDVSATTVVDFSFLFFVFSFDCSSCCC